MLELHRNAYNLILIPGKVSLQLHNVASRAHDLVLVTPIGHAQRLNNRFPLANSVSRGSG